MVLTFPMAASARPAGFSSAVCDPSSTDICSMTLASTWTCDLGAVADGSSGATIHVIYDSTGTICETSSTSHNYCAWGTDGNGDDFYCDTSNAYITIVRVLGTSPTSGLAGDEISFQYDESSVAYDLADHVLSIAGLVIAEDGDDTISGSRSTSSRYKDRLFGDDGHDTIRGFEGEDEIHGGGGDDIIKGDEGDDEIYGDAGDDDISGGDDQDEIFGGIGEDEICGDDGDDVLDGQSNDDQLWGGPGADWKDGGPEDTADACDAAGTNVNCEDTITNPPEGCP